MNSPYSQQQYLQRKPTESTSSFFDWLFCCTVNRQLPQEEVLETRRQTVFAKRPLKSRGTHLCSQSRIKLQENTRGQAYGVLTERKNMESSSAQPMKMSLFEHPLNRTELSTGQEGIRRTCKIRFSYAGPPEQLSSLQKKLPQVENSRKPTLSVVTSKDNSKMMPAKATEQISPADQLGQSAQFAQRACDQTNTSEVLSPVSPLTFGRKDSLQSPRHKKGRKGASRLSLKIRQVESIRQPQDDSDHESIVVKDDNDGLFGLLSPIRQVEKESRLQI